MTYGGSANGIFVKENKKDVKEYYAQNFQKVELRTLKSQILTLF